MKIVPSQITRATPCLLAVCLPGLHLLQPLDWSCVVAISNQNKRDSCGFSSPRALAADAFLNSLLSGKHLGSTARPSRGSLAIIRFTVGGRFKSLDLPQYSGSSTHCRKAAAMPRHAWWVRLFRHNLPSPHLSFWNVIDQPQWLNTASIDCAQLVAGALHGRFRTWKSWHIRPCYFGWKNSHNEQQTETLHDVICSCVLHFRMSVSLGLFLLRNYATRSRCILHVA